MLKKYNLHRESKNSKQNTISVVTYRHTSTEISASTSTVTSKLAFTTTKSNLFNMKC